MVCTLLNPYQDGHAAESFDQHCFKWIWNCLWCVLLLIRFYILHFNANVFFSSFYRLMTVVNVPHSLSWVTRPFKWEEQIILRPLLGLDIAFASEGAVTFYRNTIIFQIRYSNNNKGILGVPLGRAQEGWRAA